MRGNQFASSIQSVAPAVILEDAPLHCCLLYPNNTASPIEMPEYSFKDCFLTRHDIMKLTELNYRDVSSILTNSSFIDRRLIIHPGELPEPIVIVCLHGISAIIAPHFALFLHPDEITNIGPREKEKQISMMIPFILEQVCNTVVSTYEEAMAVAATTMNSRIPLTMEKEQQQLAGNNDEKKKSTVNKMPPILENIANTSEVDVENDVKNLLSIINNSKSSNINGTSPSANTNVNTDALIITSNNSSKLQNDSIANSDQISLFQNKIQKVILESILDYITSDLGKRLTTLQEAAAVFASAASGDDGTKIDTEDELFSRYAEKSRMQTISHDISNAYKNRLNVNDNLVFKSNDAMFSANKSGSGGSESTKTAGEVTLNTLGITVTRVTFNEKTPWISTLKIGDPTVSLDEMEENLRQTAAYKKSMDIASRRKRQLTTLATPELRSANINSNNINGGRKFRGNSIGGNSKHNFGVENVLFTGTTGSNYLNGASLGDNVSESNNKIGTLNTSSLLNDRTLDSEGTKEDGIFQADTARQNDIFKKIIDETNSANSVNRKIRNNDEYSYESSSSNITSDDEEKGDESSIVKKSTGSYIEPRSILNNTVNNSQGGILSIVEKMNNSSDLLGNSIGANSVSGTNGIAQTQRAPASSSGGVKLTIADMIHGAQDRKKSIASGSKSINGYSKLSTDENGSSDSLGKSDDGDAYSSINKEDESSNDYNFYESRSYTSSYESTRNNKKRQRRYRSSSRDRQRSGGNKGTIKHSMATAQLLIQNNSRIENIKKLKKENKLVAAKKITAFQMFLANKLPTDTPLSKASIAMAYTTDAPFYSRVCLLHREVSALLNMAKMISNAITVFVESCESKYNASSAGLNDSMRNYTTVLRKTAPNEQDSLMSVDMNKIDELLMFQSPSINTMNKSNNEGSLTMTGAIVRDSDGGRFFADGSKANHNHNTQPSGFSDGKKLRQRSDENDLFDSDSFEPYLFQTLYVVTEADELLSVLSFRRDNGGIQQDQRRNTLIAMKLQTNMTIWSVTCGSFIGGWVGINYQTPWDPNIDSISEAEDPTPLWCIIAFMIVLMVGLTLMWAFLKKRRMAGSE